MLRHAFLTNNHPSPHLGRLRLSGALPWLGGLAGPVMPKWPWEVARSGPARRDGLAGSGRENLSGATPLGRQAGRWGDAAGEVAAAGDRHPSVGDRAVGGPAEGAAADAASLAGAPECAGVASNCPWRKLAAVGRA